MSNEAAREKFRTYLANKGLRATGQRLAIFEAAFAQLKHFTADELLDYARRLDDSVSRATIYRTLPLMVESTLLREVDVGHDLNYYHPNSDFAEASPSSLAQVVCRDCDKIFEINAPFMSWYGHAVSHKLGLTAVSQRLQVSASCDSFKRGEVCKNRVSA